MSLSELQAQFRAAKSNAEKLRIVAATIALLGEDYPSAAAQNAAKGFPCPLLRQCSVVMLSIY